MSSMIIVFLIGGPFIKFIGSPKKEYKKIIYAF